MNLSSSLKIKDVIVLKEDGVKLTTEQEVALEKIGEGVQESVLCYFRYNGLSSEGGLYDFVLSGLERPLLSTVLNFVKGNQSLAAVLLGVSRGTLRKKMKQYGMLD
jgi:Fis family transcriptional regulator